MRPVTTVLRDDPYNSPEPAFVEFRLTYEGLLLGASPSDTRVKQKHEIRQHFHRQLKRLWEVHSYLKHGTPVEFFPGVSDSQKQLGRGYVSYVHTEKMAEFVAKKYEMFGFRFVPLVREQLSLLCSIHILFLRPDRPGSIIRSADIDNRMKVLFDALRIPKNADELRGAKPADGENPFFCLLEDDSLITHVSVETDMLLQPTGQDYDDNDTRLILNVRIRPYENSIANEGFA